MDAEGAKSGLAPSVLLQSHASDLEGVAPTPLGRVHIEILELMCSQEEPLMLREVARLTEVPRHELEPVIAELCALQLVRRLNTVIPSYAAGPTTSG